MIEKTVPGVIVVVLSLSLLSGCQSVPERVKELSDNAYFKEASTVIAKEQDKLSKNPDVKKLKELEQARQLFEKSVSEHFGKETENLNSQGKAREALNVSLEAYQLCPWSATIQSMVTRFRDKVAVLDRLQEKWHDQISSGQISSSDSRLAILDLTNIRSDIADSPDLIALDDIASKGVLSYWADRLNEDRLRLASDDESDMFSDLDRLLPDRTKADGIEKVVRTIQDLIGPTDSASGGANQTNIPTEIVLALYTDSSQSPFDAQTQPIRQVLRTQFENWIQEDYSKTLLFGDISFERIKQSEFLFEKIPSLASSVSFRHALSAAHLSRAKQLLKGGLSSALAFFFLQRSTQLEDPSVIASVIDSIDRNARVYLSTTKYPDFSLSMDIDPTIPLDTQGIVFSAFSNSFLGRSKQDRPWRLVPPDSKDQDISVLIESAEIDVPDLDKLPQVTSQYFSHYESVPNPAKESLRFQLSLQESDVEFAKSTYESAVSSYNIDPTDWALNEANSAYNNYQWAINSYNALVDRYNLTPSTIQQPVNLPYSFVQGDVRLGCRLTLRLGMGENSYRFSSQSFDTCFVRFGSKPTDTNPTTRRDIGFTFDVSFERLLVHLNKAVDEICDKMRPLLIGLNYPTYIPLSSDETVLLQCLMHPWGFDESEMQGLDLPKWEKAAIGSVTVASLQLDLPKVTLQVNKNNIKGPMQTETAVKAFEPLVCLIESVKNGEAISSGTGTLVGPGGLVLTCAHVLNSPTINVKLPTGGDKGSYESEIVFVNEKCDVALIRAKGLSNKDWATLRLKTSAAKGERIIAIGNPAVDQATLNLGGASAGIVSNPQVSTFGQDELIADITVASGSSGGPLFSLDNGDLIGVVLAVTQPGIRVEGISSSGSYCLAAPADMLGKWLGLKYPD